MISWESIKKHKLGIPLIWDISMVFIVLGNLSLILFDLSYLSLRPFYFDEFPKILKVYDKRILGIEPHRTTKAYTDSVDDLDYLIRLKDPEFWESEIVKNRQSIYSVLKKLKLQVSSEKFDKLFEDFETLLNSENTKDKNKKIEFTLLQLNEYISVLEETPEIDELLELTERSNLIIQSSDPIKEKAEFEKILSYMDRKMLEIVETNPFASSGQIELFFSIQDTIKGEYRKHKTKAKDIKIRQELDLILKKDRIPETVVAFDWFWRNPDRSYQEKIEFFNLNLRRNFDLNFYRALGADGNPVNHYLLLDLPFLIFFLIEFLLSWLYAIRNKSYIAWFLYPVYHWYDVLGLIPIVEFRFFRLIRVYKIYLMLQTNQFTKILGNDLLSRSLRYYSNVIKEEISDLVTLQILTETQNEVKSGNSLDQLVGAIDANREELKKVVLNNITKSAQNENLRELIKNLVGEISENVATQIRPIALLPKEAQAAFSKQVSQAIYQAISTASFALANDPMGRKSIEKLIDYAIDEMILFAKDPDMVKLNTNITVSLIENMKRGISEKKWLKAEISKS